MFEVVCCTVCSGKYNVFLKLYFRVDESKFKKYVAMYPAASRWSSTGQLEKNGDVTGSFEEESTPITSSVLECWQDGSSGDGQGVDTNPLTF